MIQNKSKEAEGRKHRLTPEVYDKYASPVYRKIFNMVGQESIAERIHEKVFIYAFRDDTTFPLRSPLMSLIDIADEKSSKTIKALEIFRACCHGTSVGISDKK
mgnify:CR=1 FL=1|tara:strand:- start:301 stop:609 length:309 start_codon:yes stop_codon:yes gene_type:complete